MKTQNFGYKKLYINGELLDAESGQIEDVICPATGEIHCSNCESRKSRCRKSFECCKKRVSILV